MGCSLGDLSDPGLEPTSLALAGRFFTTETPENKHLINNDSSKVLEL